MVALLAGASMPKVVTAASPPQLSLRAVPASTDATNSQQVMVHDGEVKFTLFLPGMSPSKATTLTLHFHTTPGFVIQEHLRRGSANPLAVFHLGEGSTVYRQAFEDRQRLSRCLKLIEGHLRQFSGNASSTVATLELSSFSAGYGAIREIIKSPEYFARVRTVLLADSMYGALETNASAYARVPWREHIAVWIPLARAAVKGEKTFLITCSDVPTTTYASSRECAEALIQAAGLRTDDVVPGSCAAAADPQFPLRWRADAGRLHVWGYGGTNAQAHLTHVRHLADLWRAVEQP